MEEDIVTIKEEISSLVDTFTVYVTEEDVKEKRTENQAMGIFFIHFFRMIDFCLFLELWALQSKNFITINFIYRYY